MLRIESITFPEGYEICEGHDWMITLHVVEADGTTTERKEVCRHCDTLVRRTHR